MISYTQLPRSLTLLSLLFAAFIGQAAAVTHLREGPRPNKANVMLHGSAIVDSYWDGTSGTRKQVGWSAGILKDIITWYDLSEDNIQIRSCSQNHVELEGNMLDPDDYKPNSVFVIDLVDWESSCPTPQVESGIPEEDDVLFYEIESAETGTNNRINLSVKRINGENVVPGVTIDAAENQGVLLPDGPVGQVEIFGDDKAAAVARQALSLPRMSHMDQLENNTSLLPEVSLAFSAGVSAGISGFKLVRLRGLKFRWVQRLAAEAKATFSVTKTFEEEKTGRLLQVPVSGFGFRTRRIPFVGRASAGAYVRVDWVLEMNAEATFTADFDIRREIRHRVQAKIFPPTFSTEELTPLEENRQSSSMVFNAEAEAGVNGFAGVRPALGVVASLGRKNAGGNLGLKVGMQMHATIRTPPFLPATSGITLGVCDECHALQGGLDIKIKDLTLQLERNREVTNEITLVENIFDFNVATLCALPRACDGATNPLPSQIPCPDSKC